MHFCVRYVEFDRGGGYSGGKTRVLHGAVHPREATEPDGVPGRAAGGLVSEREGEAGLAVPPAAHEHPALAGAQPGHNSCYCVNTSGCYEQKESKEFADAATLADHELQNDSVVYMCWKKENQWEELSVTKVEALDSGDASGSAGSSGAAGNSAKAEA
ncbi:hypothetical protein ON010_g1216 [Phytophthora cinnamomi]|nr:hypothetical protein ON010_g1216 [Phytophthora cinnamomi]